MVYRIATIKKDNSSGEKIIVFDERTGKTFECEPESSLDHAAAIFSIIYLSLTNVVKSSLPILCFYFHRRSTGWYRERHSQFLDMAL